MKPKDLKPVFTFENRRPLLKDGVFYLPDHFTKFSDYPLIDWSEIFERGAPVAIEYCAGNGAWIEKKAMQEGDKNWIAVEKRFDRIQKIWSKKKNHQLNNLFAVCGEGKRFTQNYLQASFVDEVYVNFPDPWPKKKHEKHRLMKKDFLDEMARILKSKGTLTFVTDDRTYLDATLALFIEHAEFQLAFEAPGFICNLDGYGDSYFDTLWRDKGRVIHYAQFIRR